MNNYYDRYLIKQRAGSDVNEHGSVEKAIQHLETELQQMEALWSKYSCDCLGHGIICTELKISWLKTNHL